MTAAVEAVRQGAAQSLAEILRARRPDLAVEVTFGEVEGDRRAGGHSANAEARRLEAGSDDSDAPETPAAANPDDADRAA